MSVYSHLRCCYKYVKQDKLVFKPFVIKIRNFLIKNSYLEYATCVCDIIMLRLDFMDKSLVEIHKM